MTTRVENFLANVGADSGAEEFLTLLENSAAHIGRIVSHGHGSPDGFFYNQPNDEWVMLVRGSATLEYADGARIEMRAGDYVTISRHVKHRVASVSDDAVWLAVHVKYPTL